jgi:anti-anti-sigma factor
VQLLVVATRHGLEAVRVTGEIDTASTDAIENVLREILERSPDRVELDLRGVAFLDDAGHQMIARASEYARARRVALQIVRPHRKAAPLRV